MSREELVTDETANLLKSIHAASGGLNLYFMQGLTRHLDRADKSRTQN